MININEADKHAVTALARLNTPGNDVLLIFFASLVDETKDKLVGAREMDIIHRLQGRAEAYQDLLKAVEDAVKVENARKGF